MDYDEVKEDAPKWAMNYDAGPALSVDPGLTGSQNGNDPDNGDYTISVTFSYQGANHYHVSCTVSGTDGLTEWGPRTGVGEFNYDGTGTVNFTCTDGTNPDDTYSGEVRFTLL